MNHLFHIEPLKHKVHIAKSYWCIYWFWFSAQSSLGSSEGVLERCLYHWTQWALHDQKAHWALLLLLLGRFSRVWLCATPKTAPHQAPPSLGFSRQEHWSGLPFPSPMNESESESQVALSCLTLRDPMNCSPPGSSAHWILQARVLEWGAIAFSNIQHYMIRKLMWRITWLREASLSYALVRGVTDNV